MLINVYTHIRLDKFHKFADPVARIIQLHSHIASVCINLSAKQRVPAVVT